MWRPLSSRFRAACLLVVLLPLAAWMGGRIWVWGWFPASQMQLWVWKPVKQQKAVDSIAAWQAAHLIHPFQTSNPRPYVATSYYLCPSLISPLPDRPSPSPAPPPPPWQLLLIRLVRPVACWREGRWTLDGHLPSHGVVSPGPAEHMDADDLPLFSRANTHLSSLRPSRPRR